MIYREGWLKMFERSEIIISLGVNSSYMDKSDFEHEVLSGGKNEYVGDDVLSFFKDTAEFRVIERSALEKGDVEQTEFISVALPESGSNFSDDDLVDKVKEAMTDGARDVQNYQMRDGGQAPNTIEIWRHGSGFSAFALCE